MKITSTFLFLSLTLACLFQLNAIPLPGTKQVKKSPARITKSGGIERDYRAGKLTEAQEKIVIALAKKQGVQQVARISTVHFHPSAARGIRVDGAKEVNGREVSYKVLSVNFKPWFHPGGGPRKGDVKIETRHSRNATQFRASYSVIEEWFEVLH